MCPARPPAPRRLPLSAHSCGDRAAWCAAASSISPPSTTWRKVSECAHAHVLRTHARLHATGGPGDREVLSSSRASEVGSSWQGPNWGEGAKPGEGRVLGALGLGMGASGAPAGRILFCHCRRPQMCCLWPCPNGTNQKLPMPVVSGVGTKQWGPVWWNQGSW